MNSPSINDVGEILHQINEDEIPFRFENLVAIGFRWAVVGYEGHPEPGQMRLYRAEIDDGIQGTLQYTDKVPDKLRFLGFSEDSFSIKNANEQLKSLHLIQKDWLERGEAEEIVTAISDLSNAICKRYPESKFSEWYIARFGNREALTA
jgi:hypothetical protein